MRLSRSLLRNTFRFGSVVALLVAPPLGWAGSARTHTAQLLVGPGETYAGVLVPEVESDDFSVVLNDDGAFVFMAVQPNGAPVAWLRGNIFNPAQRSVVAAIGQTVAGFTLTDLSQDGIAMNAAGAIRFVAYATQFPAFEAGLFTGSNSTVAIPGQFVGATRIEGVANAGNAIDAGGVSAFTGTQFGSPVGATSLFYGTREVTRDGAIFAARTLDFIPQDSRPIVNAQGSLMFLAYVAPGGPFAPGLFRDTNGVQTALLTTGQVIPGFGAVDFIYARPYDLDDAGNYACIVARFPVGDDPVLAIIRNGAVYFEQSDALISGETLRNLEQSTLLISGRGSIFFLGDVNDGSKFGSRALVSREGIALAAGDPVGPYVVDIFSPYGESIAVDSDDRILAGVRLRDEVGNSFGGLVLLTPNELALGDLNCNGAVNVGDIGPFVTALTNPAFYAFQFPTCNINNGDINHDGVISVGDIAPFVALLTGQ